MTRSGGAGGGGALRAEKVSARYGRRGPLVLDGVSIEVPRGLVLGLSGPSGSGKSTLARVLTGLLAPASGRVTIDDVEVVARRGRMSGRLGMLFQSPRRSCSPHASLRQTILEPMRLGRAPSRSIVRPSLDEVCELVGLTEDLLDRLPGQVSLGQLQRACLARAVLAGPEFLVCDEATAMLDASSAAAIAQVVRGLADRGTGVLAISHDLALLEAWADDVVDIATTHAG